MTGFLDKHINGKEHNWLWFICTVVFGASPLILSLIIELSKINVSFLKLYKIVDIIGWGLTLCVANLNLISGKNFDLTRGVYLALSFLGLFVFTSCLVIVQFSDVTGIVFDIGLHICVLFTILMSFAANRYIIISNK